MPVCEVGSLSNSFGSLSRAANVKVYWPAMGS